VVFLSVMLCAPVLLHADSGDLESITVDPGYVNLGALGQSTSYTAIAHYEGGTPADEDVTDTADREINNPVISTNNGGGLFTATGFGEPVGPAINERLLSSYEKTASGFSTLFYNRILRRNPEKEGLDAWIARLESGEITGADLIQQFIFGEECQKIISGYSNEEFLTFLYKAIFNRKPGEAALNAWLARMGAGMTKEKVVKQFGLSEEFVNLCKFFGIKPYPGYVESAS